MARTTTATVAIVADIAALRALDVTGTGQTVGDVVGVGSTARGITLYVFTGPQNPAPSVGDQSYMVPGWVRLRP